MRKILILILLLIIVSDCSHIIRARHDTIHIMGSDTMLILASRWAEEYMKISPNTSVYVEGGGSHKGFEALIQGKTDICTASRPVLADEARLLAERYNKIGMNFLVAKDALSIYVHPENPVKNLTIEQLAKIYRGEITNWSQIGGKMSPILVLIRSPNSGTYIYFREHILEGEPYSQFAQILTSTSAIVKAVQENEEAIGYGGLAYGKEVVHCRINNVEPTEENVRNDTYPITRYLYLYTIDSPRGIVKQFINYTLKEGQAAIRDVGYIPLW
ncbi:MAG: phosphate ABC transporter substrate-binding protein [Candidatus Zhuqueibacterota bacterium]